MVSGAGRKVIPTVYRGLPQSYWFCFDGIEKGSTVAVTTLGVRTEKDFFLQGYREMLRRIEPQGILCYGKPFEEMEGNLVVVDYAETNHLAVPEKSFIKKTAGCILGQNDILTTENTSSQFDFSPAAKYAKYDTDEPFTSPLSCVIIRKTGYVIQDGFGFAGSSGNPFQGDSEPGEVTQGKSRAPKNGRPGSIYEQVDNNGNVTSRTEYGDNGKPEYRDDLSGRPHYDKNTDQYLDQHRHTYKYNDRGQPIGETVSSIPD